MGGSVHTMTFFVDNDEKSRGTILAVLILDSITKFCNVFTVKVSSKIHKQPGEYQFLGKEWGQVSHSNIRTGKYV